MNESNATGLQAVFQTLCHYGLSCHAELPGAGLLITVRIVLLPSVMLALTGMFSQGKGYPDIATRHLVKTLSDNLPDR